MVMESCLMDVYRKEAKYRESLGLYRKRDGSLADHLATEAVLPSWDILIILDHWMSMLHFSILW
jgi:hypothetical protein